MFDNEMKNTRKTLERVPEDKFSWKLHAKSMELGRLSNLPRAAVLRALVLNHMIHHSVQLGVYLRLNGVPVPSIYGPSADEANS